MKRVEIVSGEYRFVGRLLEDLYDFGREVLYEGEQQIEIRLI